MLPQAKEHLGPSEAERGKEGFLPTALRGSLTYQHLEFGLLTSIALTE